MGAVSFCRPWQSPSRMQCKRRKCNDCGELISEFGKDCVFRISRNLKESQGISHGSDSVLTIHNNFLRSTWVCMVMFNRQQLQHVTLPSSFSCRRSVWPPCTTLSLLAPSANELHNFLLDFALKAFETIQSCHQQVGIQERIALTCETLKEHSNKNIAAPKAQSLEAVEWVARSWLVGLETGASFLTFANYTDQTATGNLPQLPSPSSPAWRIWPPRSTQTNAERRASSRKSPDLKIAEKIRVRFTSREKIETKLLVS